MIPPLLSLLAPLSALCTPGCGVVPLNTSSASVVFPQLPGWGVQTNLGKRVSFSGQALMTIEILVQTYWGNPVPFAKMS